MSAFLCPYCGEHKSDGERSLEHPMPRALGGQGFSTRDVCGFCNERAGREVDRPFAEHFIIHGLRHRYDIRDARGDVPPAPWLPGKDSDGGRILLELGKEPRTRRVPHKTRDDATGVTYLTELGEGEALLEKLKVRGEKRAGPGYRVDANVETVLASDKGTIPVSIPMTLWPRFMAKLALAFGREALGDNWATSKDAEMLRTVLWNTPDAPATNPLCEQTDEEGAFARVAPAPAHLVLINPLNGGCGVIVQLFGRLIYGCPLSETLTEPEHIAWTFDPVKGTARRTSLAELIGAQSRPFSPKMWDV